MSGVDSTDYDPSEYGDVSRESMERFSPAGIATGLSDARRFVHHDSRERRGMSARAQLAPYLSGKYRLHWKGVQLLKDPMTLVSLQHLLYAIRPGTIFDFGTFLGSSAMWFKDMADTLGIDVRVVSIDRDLSLRHPAAAARADIEWLEVDLMKPWEGLSEKFLSECSHPWLLDEDCHVNLELLMEHFHPHTRAGDYWFVEDTNPHMNQAAPEGDLAPDYEMAGPEKLNLLHRFLAEHPDDYRIDTYFTDLFGYNGGLNWDSFVRRVEA